MTVYLLVWHLPTLHCTVTGLTPERFVTLCLPLWTHLRTRYWGVFAPQDTQRFALCAWPMVLQKLGNRWNLIPLQKGDFQMCSWNRWDVVLFIAVWKITPSRKNLRELLGDAVMTTVSHHNCTIEVTLIEFEQLLQVRKWEFVFTLQSHFVHFSQDH